MLRSGGAAALLRGARAAVRRGLSSVEGVSERERLRRLAKERLFKAQQGSGGMSTWLTLGGVSGVMSGFVGYVTADEDFLKGSEAPESSIVFGSSLAPHPRFFRLLSSSE
eukprot:scaffold680_cov264-Pinguiococcus_pyrenoidosus.AAC.26